jgi:hypothetical protein
MSLKKCIGLVSMAVLGGAIAVGCSSSDSGNNNNGTDSGPPAADGGGKKDTGVVPTDDPGPTDDGGVTECKPGAVDGFTPTFHPPKAATPVCTAELIASFGKCLDAASATDPACTPWGTTADAAHKACGTCFFSNDTDAKWGPNVSFTASKTQQNNVSGCISLKEGNVTATSCGAKVQASNECAGAACKPNCPTTSQAEVDALNACSNSASLTVCKTFADPADACINAIADAGTADACFVPDSATFGDQFVAIATVFCGGKVGDAAAE